MLEEYLLSQQLRGRSPNTIKWYRTFLSRFLDYFRKPNHEITTQDIRSFLVVERERGNKQTSIATKIGSLRSFFKWLLREEQIPKNPMERIDIPKLPPAPPKYLTHDEIESLRDACNDPMDQLLVEVLYSSGVRVSELTGLDRKDFNPTNKTITVTGKGNKTRTVPLSTRAARLLQKYLKTRKDLNPWIFNSRESNRMSKETVERRIRNLGKNAELQRKVTPHHLRHTYATHLLEAGVPIDMIQSLLDHALITTTRQYARTEMSNVGQYHRRVFP